MVRAINDEWIAKGDMRCPGTSFEYVFVTPLHKWEKTPFNLTLKNIPENIL